jgi:3-oxoacyl-[acyl-carrier protein] reductase
MAVEIYERARRISPMNLELNGKVALVTAASKGIGRAVVKELATEGARVAMSSSSGLRLSDALKTMPEIAHKISLHPADLADPQATASLFKNVIAEYGRLDILVMNTPGPRILPFVETTAEDWANAYNILVRPAVELALLASRQMVEQGGGSIVFLTSTWVKQPSSGGVLSSTMRSAISAMCKQMAIELAGHNIRVNQVMPGATGTDRMKTIMATKAAANSSSEEEETARAVREIPLGRWAQPEEIASAVAFLASARSAFTTGASLQLDGGAIRSTL